jgi:hypothetical protein
MKLNQQTEIRRKMFIIICTLGILLSLLHLCGNRNNKNEREREREIDTELDCCLLCIEALSKMLNVRKYANVLSRARSYHLRHAASTAGLKVFLDTLKIMIVGKYFERRSHTCKCARGFFAGALSSSFRRTTICKRLKRNTHEKGWPLTRALSMSCSAPTPWPALPQRHRPIGSGSSYATKGRQCQRPTLGKRTGIQRKTHNICWHLLELCQGRVLLQRLGKCCPGRVAQLVAVQAAYECTAVSATHNMQAFI